jgi:hypothetical protein
VGLGGDVESECSRHRTEATSDGSTVIRVYESSGKARWSQTEAARQGELQRVNLIEDAGRKLSVSNDTLQFDMGPMKSRPSSCGYSRFNKLPLCEAHKGETKSGFPSLEDLIPPACLETELE